MYSASLGTARVYWWDRTLQYQAPRVIWALGAEPEEIMDATDAFVALGKLSASDIRAFLSRLAVGDRPLAIQVMKNRGVDPAVIAEAQKPKRFPTKAVAIGAGVVGVLLVGALVLR